MQMELALADDGEMSRAEWLAAEEVAVVEPMSSSPGTPGQVDALPGGAEDGLDSEWCSFQAAARAQGYGNNEALMLYRTLPRLDLDGASGVAWMREGFTPWAARVWIGTGLDDPFEAHELQRWHLSAEEGYWARRDGMAQPYLRVRRQLMEWMARSLLG